MCRWGFEPDKIFRGVRGARVEGHSCAGGPFTWRGGMNNQSESRFD